MTQHGCVRLQEAPCPPSHFPQPQETTGSEDLMVPQWEQILEKYWQSWPSSPTWFSHLTSSFPSMATIRLHHFVNYSHLPHHSKHHQHGIRAEAGPRAAFLHIWCRPDKESKTHFKTASFAGSLRHLQERGVENLIPCYLSHQHCKITSLHKGY